MSIVSRIKALVVDSHATGYASELPASVTRLFDELAGELEKLKPDAAASAAGVASAAGLDQLGATLRGELATALEQAEQALGGKVGDLVKQLAAQQADAVSALRAELEALKAWVHAPAPPTQPAAQPAPQPAAQAAPAAAAAPVAPAAPAPSSAPAPALAAPAGAAPNA